MPRQIDFNVLFNRPLTASVYELILEGDTGGITAPGQFVNIELADFFLRRPISVCDWRKGRLTLIYKQVGQGTKALSAVKPGTNLNLLTGLGNGYDLSASGARPLVVGGGVGIPPLFALTRELLAHGKIPTVLLGFNTKSEIFYDEQFQNLGADVVVATADGSAGKRGFVTDVIKSEGMQSDYFFACGPLNMLKALCETIPPHTSGQLSLEERMACGFGACMGCSIQTAAGSKRVCKDGPVFQREVLLW